MELLAEQIEQYLLTKGTWVPVFEIAQRFEINERLLRADKERRPICAGYAISSTRGGHHGIKHLKCCTIAERLAYKHNRWKRLIAEKRAIREYEHAVHNCLTGKRPELIERHTGQLVFFP
jgi:hypothetical protein